jgi:hypothetical protein
MRCWTAMVISILAATHLAAQDIPRQTNLDSGTVVRLHWKDGTEKARLLAPLEPASSVVQYCRYPSPACGTTNVNPSQTRSVGDLTRLDIRQGSRAGPGALVGAGVGALGGLLIIFGHSLGDLPASSTGEQVLTVALLAGVWSGLGALVGTSLDDWEAVPR